MRLFLHRRVLPLLLPVVFLSCVQTFAGTPWKVAAREPEVALPAGAAWLRFTVEGEESVEFQVVRFSAERCTLRIIDQPVRADAVSLGTAMKRTSALAGVNGGFFNPAFEPLGLVIAQGRRAGSWQKSSLLGGVVVVRKGRLMLLWRDEFQEAPGISELLQAGPRLVNHGVAITGLESGRSRPRTFIATDDAGHWMLGIAQYTSLAHLAQILATPGLVLGLEIDRALNFDGGKSTGLWLRTATGAVEYEEEISTVRNFVAVMPRD
ncbi:MAG: Protein of unknown function periplasmic [Verrucomicrobiaceae bacterium]|nr:Protein of unknown function periplasmic [Verrucomicrobiaceae bacterium]